MSHWRILKDKGRTYSMEQWFNAVVECLEELKEQLNKLEVEFKNHIEHYHTP